TIGSAGAVGLFCTAMFLAMVWPSLPAISLPSFRPNPSAVIARPQRPTSTTSPVQPPVVPEAQPPADSAPSPSPRHADVPLVVERAPELGELNSKIDRVSKQVQSLGSRVAKVETSERKLLA